MASLSVKDQDERLRAANASFRLIIDTWWMGVWEGELRPIGQTYRIRIRYFPYRFWKNVTIGHPYVTVKAIDPLVAPNVRGTGERTPHVYSYGYPPDIPALCIWDPVLNEWGPHEYIVDKIVPWTVKWLLFYEDWLDTGVWQGRGRHPEIAPQQGSGSTPILSPNARAKDNSIFYEFAGQVGLYTSGIALAVGEDHFSAGSWPEKFGRSKLSERQIELRSK
ncbi:hypothetical protein NKI79_26675 [Mesorhizobium sp. M0340]|uniref:hypothetical protein n=1 Tax=Mesorhizobium sp. M0340 TaxID=2956939 RepID=UPI0033357555